jgi:transglutaminase-like putative cysteine protease
MVLYLPQFAAVRDRLNGLGDMKDNIPMSPYYREFPEGAEFEIDRTVVVEAYGSFSYTIKIAQPMDINDGATLVQDTLGFQPSKTPDENQPDVSSTQNIMLIWDDTITGGSDSLTVRYHVKTQTRDWLGEYDIDGEKSGTVADINGTWKNVYNNDEWRIDLNSNGILDSEDDLDNDGQWNYRIEPSNPAIISLSNQLTSGKTNVYDKILSIYEYLISDDILDYETIRGGGLPKACTTTLSDLRGDCDDYSILFISLCRAANIPARLALGLLYDPDNDKWIGHGWSEVYIPMKSGGAILGTVDVVNKQFLLRDPYRLTDWLDTGGDVIYNGEYVNNLDFYYYSFTYRGQGKKVSDEYNTVSYKPLGGKVRVEMSQSEVTGQPSDGDGSSGSSYLPGFEAFSAIIAASIAAAVLAARGTRRQFKHR